VGIPRNGKESGPGDIYGMTKVYLISSAAEGGTVYKIGHTGRDVHDRIRDLSTGNSSPMVVESFFASRWARKIESALHRHFRSRRVSGEWFDLGPDQVAEFLVVCQRTHDALEVLERDNTYVASKGGVVRI
jgi:hypothetical protein